MERHPGPEAGFRAFELLLGLPVTVIDNAHFFNPVSYTHLTLPTNSRV